MTHPLEPALASGLEELGLALSDAQRQQLLDYLDLLFKWNKVYNLTAVRDPREMLTHHLLDSLAVVPALRRHAAGRALRVLDVGAGAGLPALVFAVCQPDWTVHAVDAVGKKAAFMQQAALALRLGGFRAHHARVQDLREHYDVVSCRAFAALADFTAWSVARLSPGACWLAMKGKRPDSEIAALPPEVAVFHVEPVAVPGLDAERCLVWLRPAAGG